MPCGDPLAATGERQPDTVLVRLPRRAGGRGGGGGGGGGALTMDMHDRPQKRLLSRKTRCSSVVLTTELLMGAGRKAPVIAVEILDHLGAFKRQPTRADTAGENDHRCQKRSKRRLHVRAAGARRQVAARPPVSSTVYRHPDVKRRLTSSRGHQDGSP